MVCCKSFQHKSMHFGESKIVIDFSKTDFAIGSKFYLDRLDSIGGLIKKDSFIHRFEIDTLIVKITEPYIAILTKYTANNDIGIISPMFFTADSDISIKLDRISGYSTVEGRENRLFKDKIYAFLNPINVKKYGSIDDVFALYNSVPKTNSNYKNWSEYEAKVYANVREYSDYYYTLFQLYVNRKHISNETIEKCLDILSQNYSETPLFITLKKFMKTRAVLYINTAFPCIILKDTAMKDVQSESIFHPHKEDYIIIFGASWCTPCHEQSRIINSRYSNVDTNLHQLISMSIEADSKEWLNSVKQMKLNWSSYLVPNSKLENSALFEKITSIPMYVILDNNKHIKSIKSTVDSIFIFTQ